MTFNTPCNSQMLTWTDTARVTLCQGVSSGALGKYLSLSMYFPSNPSWYPVFTPGCCGTYTCIYNNNGTLAQPSFVMQDDIPAELDVTSISGGSIPAANLPMTVDIYCWTGTTCSATPCSTVTVTTSSYAINSLPANVCKVKWSYSGSVAVSQTVYNYLDVCVRSTRYTNGSNVLAGQNIVNTLTASATNLSPISVTHTKVVDATQPKVIATKMFIGDCNPSCQVMPYGPFQPGDTVRFRIAVANIGNANATTCNISDNLPAGLSYVGNETYFYGSFNWMANIYNPPCCSLTVAVPTQIGGTLTSPSVGATNLTWQFPTLPGRCDGTVDYFLIDFDVKISSNPPAPPGNYTNTFTFSASNVTNVPSNPAILTVNATAQVQALKEVQLAPSGPWGPSVTAPAGGAANYRLTVKNTGNTALTNLCLLDIMPWNGDIKVLPAYSSRGSLFDLPYNPANGAITITPTGFPATYNNVALNNTKNPRRSVVCGGFCGVADPPGTVVGNFVAAPQTTYSFKITANTGVNLAPGATLSALVPVKTPSSGVGAGANACNSFAIQTTPQGMSTVCLLAESNPACITIAQKPPCFKIVEQHLDCVGQNANGQWVYQLAFSITNGSGTGAYLNINPTTGSITSGNNQWLPLGGPTNITATYVTPTPSGSVCFWLTLNGNGVENPCDTSFCLDLPPCREACPCPFQMVVKDPKAYQASGNNVIFQNWLSVLGTGIQRVRANIVTATVTETCRNQVNTYTPAVSIVASNWNPAIGYGTSEVTWNNLQCPPLNNKLLTLNLNVPTAPARRCTQVVRICIRYTFTDCKCNDCDTLICFEFTRSWMPFDGGDLGGWDGGILNVVKGAEIDPSEGFASIKMTSATTGDLTINNPASDEYTTPITIVRVGVKPQNGVSVQTMQPVTSGWSMSETDPAGDGLEFYSKGVLPPGGKASFNISFGHAEDLNSWNNRVRIYYLVEGLPDTLYTDLILKARKPGASGGDVLAFDEKDEVLNKVKTVALKFENANYTADHIAYVIVRPLQGKILATGSAPAETEIALTATKAEDGQVKLLLDPFRENMAERAPLAPGGTTATVYLTLMTDDPTTELEFGTYTESGDLVTSGTIKQTLGSSVEVPTMKLDMRLSEAIPNPTGGMSTIRFELLKSEPAVTLTITDELGNRVDAPLSSAPMAPGLHEINYDASRLPNGVYFYTLSTGNATQTRKLIVIK
ncbi:MAG: T9SS type A sorting domain-containing protein [Chloroflexota bacterium]